MKQLWTEKHRPNNITEYVFKDEDGTEVRLWCTEWPESELMVSDEEPQTAIFSKWV